MRRQQALGLQVRVEASLPGRTGQVSAGNARFGLTAQASRQMREKKEVSGGGNVTLLGEGGEPVPPGAQHASVCARLQGPVCGHKKGRCPVRAGNRGRGSRVR